MSSGYKTVLLFFKGYWLLEPATAKCYQLWQCKHFQEWSRPHKEGNDGLLSPLAERHIAESQETKVHFVKLSKTSDSISRLLVVLVVQRFHVRLMIKRSLVRLPAGLLSSQLGQLSLPSLQGRQIKYQPAWLCLGGACSLASGGR